MLLVNILVIRKPMPFKGLHHTGGSVSLRNRVHPWQTQKGIQCFTRTTSSRTLSSKDKCGIEKRDPVKYGDSTHGILPRSAASAIFRKDAAPDPKIAVSRTFPCSLCRQRRGRLGGYSPSTGLVDRSPGSCLCSTRFVSV